MKSIFYISSFLHKDEQNSNKLYKIKDNNNGQSTIFVDMVHYNRLKLIQKNIKVVILEKLEYYFDNEQENCDFLYRYAQMHVKSEYYNTFIINPNIIP